MLDSHLHHGEPNGDLYNLLFWRQLHNQLLLMNPFDPNYKAQISLKDLERSRKSAYQASRQVNEARKRGIEPSSSAATREGSHRGGQPVTFTVDMPTMPVHPRTKKRQGAAVPGAARKGSA